MKLSKIKIRKKGQGSVIAWVLLVGFAVSLAVLVGRWSLQQSEKASSSIISTSEADLRCDSVAIGAYCWDAGSGYLNVEVRNKGTLRISKINIGGCDNLNEFEFANGYLGLNKAEVFQGACTEKYITIIPLIKIDEEFVGCSAKEINLETEKCSSEASEESNEYTCTSDSDCTDQLGAGYFCAGGICVAS